MKAVDADAGDNAKLVYSLLDNPVDRSSHFDSSPFAVDPSTGVIRAMASVDREVKAVYQFHVTAADSGSPTPFTSTALVTVNVLDVNDEAPQFKVSLTISLSFVFELSSENLHRTDPRSIAGGTLEIQFVICIVLHQKRVVQF